MKILIINNLGYLAGGAERSVKFIQDGLKARGHEVYVLCSQKMLTDQTRATAYGDEFIPEISGSAPLRIFKHLWYHEAYKTVKRIVREFQPDVCHLHTIGEFSPSIMVALSHVPTVLTVHGPEDYTLKLLTGHLLTSDFKKGSYDIRDLTLTGRARYWYYRGLQRPMFRFMFRKLKLVIAPSKFMAHMLQADFPRTPIQPIYNGIDLPDLVPLPTHPAPEILSVGRLETIKGIHFLIEAMAEVVSKIPDAHLTIVGDGTARHILEKQADKLNIAGNVTFVGWALPPQVMEYNAKATVFVIPSIWPENLPTTIIEALAVGRPVIGSKIGGIPELILPDVTGQIVEPGDATGLAEALTALLSSPKLEIMSREARAFSLQFSTDRFITDLEGVYQAINQPEREAGAAQNSK